MKRVEKDILFVLISSFALTVAWIGFNLYHKWATSTITSSLQIQIKPIAPDFDLNTLAKLKTREKIAPFETKATPSPTLAPSIPAPTIPIKETPIPEEPTPQEQIIDTITPEITP